MGHHVGTEVWYNQDSTKYRICDGSGEDPSCSNSKASFKLNADHFSYFSLEYSAAAAQCGGLDIFSAQIRENLPAMAEVFAWIVPLVVEMESKSPSLPAGILA